MTLPCISYEWHRQIVVGEGHVLASVCMFSNLLDSETVNPPAVSFSVEVNADNPIHLCLLPLSGLLHRGKSL